MSIETNFTPGLHAEEGRKGAFAPLEIILTEVGIFLHVLLQGSLID